MSDVAASAWQRVEHLLAFNGPTLPQQRTLAGGVYDIQRNAVWASHLSLRPYAADGR